MAVVIAGTDKLTGEKESVDSLIRRFNRKVNNEGTMLELKKREYYRSPSQKRREKSAEAQKRLRLKGNK